MTFAEKMKGNAKAAAKSLVLPEGTEPRTLQAARKILDEHIAKKVTLLGKQAEIEAKAKELGVGLEGLCIVDPETSEKRKDFGHAYYELRKHKGMSEEEAYGKIANELRWGAMMVRMGDADAMVGGARNTTGDVLVACFTIIKCKPGIKYASSCFVMATDKTDLGVDGSFIFADCSTIPNPTAEQLAEIAAASAESCKTFLGAEPQVAMLSYSTKGSAKGELVEKVQQATALVQAKCPDLAVDGELQLDAAIIGSVAAQKAKDSKVAGKANTLIFPDLQSGNIGYKLVQRLGGAQAYGPILQGFNHPVSDLSRGCSVEDIVVTSAVTLAQAGSMK
ncbi:MAG: phosphate acetyltransferase [Spirochaetia bacterium]|nr:phosphate acetyltransferase [Spirochaetia bacterium]